MKQWGTQKKKQSRPRIDPAAALEFVRERYFLDPTQDNLVELLYWLRNATLSVPMQMTSSEEVQKRILSQIMQDGKITAVPGQVIDPGGEMRAKVLTVTNSAGRVLLPLFTKSEDVYKIFHGTLMVYTMCLEDCYALAHELTGIQGMVLDPHTYSSIPVPFVLEEKILSLPVREEVPQTDAGKPERKKRVKEEKFPWD